MRLFALVLILSLISGCLAHSVNNDLVARGTSIIPSSSPSPTPDASSSWKNDKRRQWKHIHEFFKAYGWLKHNATIPDQDLPKAIRKIQKVLREPETGEYTERLEYVMSRPRCGTVQPYNETDANADSGLHSRYVLWGPKWDHTTITYRFLNYTAALPAEQQRNIVSAAFGQWAALLPLNFIPAPANTPRADIHIRFMSMGSDETAYAFTNMIADGLALASGLINITFNDDYNWNDDRLFNFTAVHEIGHALGLSHSKVEPAVMFAYFEGVIRPLHPDDKAAVHTVYGWRNPKWNRIDTNSGTRNIVQVSSTSSTISNQDGLYQLRANGQILWYSPSGSWASVDNNKDTVQITGSGGNLYQRHTDGSTYRYSGTGSSWQYIGVASDNVIDIVAGADQIYQRRKDGWVARWSGTGQTWTTIEQPSAQVSKQIAITDSKTLWNLLTNGDLVRSLWPYNSGSWQIVDQNPDNIAIAVGGEEFYKLQSDGSVVWLDSKEVYWKIIENAGSTGIYASGTFLYSRHGDGSIWRYTGTPEVWEQLDDRADSAAVVGDRKGVVWEMLSGGDILKLVS